MTLNMEFKECRTQKHLFVSSMWQYLSGLMLEFKKSREEAAAIMLLSWSKYRNFKVKTRESCFSNLVQHYLTELHV